MGTIKYVVYCDKSYTPDLGGDYDVYVDWGDGTSDHLVNTNTGHFYPTTNYYQITIYGSGITSLNFQNTEIQKLIDLGNFNYKSLNLAFSGCDKLEIIADNALHLSGVEERISGWSMFNGLPLKYFGVNFNTLKFNNLEGLFEGSDLEYINVSNWIIDPILGESTKFSRIFHNCYYLHTIKGIESWNTSNIQSFDSMFSSCRSLSKVDFSNWDFSSMTYGRYMLNNCSLDIKSYNSLLSSISKTTTLTDASFQANYQFYSEEAKDKRDYLINTLNWTINDRGNISPEITSIIPSYLGINIEWNNNWDYEYIYFNVNNQKTYVDPSLSATTLTGLDQNNNYNIEMVGFADDYYASEIFVTDYNLDLDGYEVKSNTTSAVTTLKLPQPFCSNPEYTTTVSSCSLDDGTLTISNSEYLTFYTFLLFDIDGNTYLINSSNATFENLPSSFYFLTATPKMDYKFYYPNECTVDWIEIHNDDVNANYSISKKPVQCTGFDVQKGRLSIRINEANNDYNVRFYDANTRELKADLTQEPNSLYILNNAKDCYVAIIEDIWAGCRTLVNKECIPTINSMSVSGIRQLFIAENDGILDYDYYNTSDDDYYLSEVDDVFFMSTKIKRINSTLKLYGIPIHNGRVSYDQTLNKTREGFIFEDVMSIEIARQTSSKLNDVLDFINKRFVVIFQDNNNSWWITGYKTPSRLETVEILTADSNQYNLRITTMTADNIITNLDEDWVNNNILDTDEPI